MKSTILIALATIIPSFAWCQNAVRTDASEATLKPTAQVAAAGVSEITLEGCLPGSAYAKVAVKAGQKVTIVSRTAAPCDSRGWTNGVGLAFYGPQGTTAYPGGMGAGPYTPLGMLIGAFSHRQINTNMSWDDENQIFYGKALFIGGTMKPDGTPASYVITSPIDGFLYLLMNDGNGYADNDGSISVKVTTLGP